MMEETTTSDERRTMLPPPPRTFRDRDELINYVREFGVTQGYVVTIKKSQRGTRIILGCDRGGYRRDRSKVEECKRRKRAPSRMINCPFEVVGKLDDDEWVLTVRNGEHNHEPLKDMSEHPYGRRFSEEEVRLIKVMTEAGMRPIEVLKALKKNNPQLHSTRTDLYNIKSRIRQGNLSEKFSRAWRPKSSRSVRVVTTLAEGSSNVNCLTSIRNFIDGIFVDSHGCLIDVVNPATQEIVSQVPSSTYDELKVAVRAARRAFSSWKNTPICRRQHIMFKFRELIFRDMEKLAEKITVEQGKTTKDARHDILRGLEVVEYACGMIASQMGELLPSASNGVDARCTREPLGVCAGICLSNASAVILLWMFPIAVTCGNTFVLIPCQKSPGASTMLAAIAAEAGFPDGVFNVVHGQNDIVNHLCEDEDVKAISLVGSNTASMGLYAKTAARGIRVQADKHSKSHMIIMPDACIDAVLEGLVAAGFGSAGQWCMSLSTVIFVGQSTAWEEKLIHRAKTLKVNGGIDVNAEVGPVISKEVKDRLCSLVQSGVESGARLILDGRDIVVPGYEKGNFIGPTILGDVTIGMECYKEEIVGPVLLCMQAGKLEEAIAIVNRNKCSTGASIFTTSGAAARKFQHEIEAGLVGVNIPVPVPLPFSSTEEASFVGDLTFCGKASLQFYTQNKVVVQQWKDRRMTGASSAALSSEEESVAILASSSGSALPSCQVSSSSIPSTPGMELLLHLQGRPRPVTAQPPSGNDLSWQGTPLALPSSPQVNSTSQVILPYTPQAAAAAAAEEYPSHGLTLAISQAYDCSGIALSSTKGAAAEPVSQLQLGRKSIHFPVASGRNYYSNLMIQKTQTCMPEGTHGENDALLSTLPPQMAAAAAATVPPTPERVYMPMSQRNLHLDLTSERIVTTERAFMPSSYERNDCMQREYRVPLAASTWDGNDDLRRSSKTAEDTVMQLEVSRAQISSLEKLDTPTTTASGSSVIVTLNSSPHRGSIFEQH